MILSREDDRNGASNYFFSACTLDDLKIILEMRQAASETHEGSIGLMVDYFLISSACASQPQGTRLGGNPFVTDNFQWPIDEEGNYFCYFGRVNFADSLDLIPACMKSFFQSRIVQLFVADSYIGVPEKEIAIHLVELDKPLVEVNASDVPYGAIVLPPAPMLKARVKCLPSLPVTEELCNEANCEIWNPKGTRVFSFQEGDDAVVHLEFSGVDINLGGFAPPGRNAEIGGQLLSSTDRVRGQLQLNGGSVIVEFRMRDHVEVVTRFDCD